MKSLFLFLFLSLFTAHAQEHKEIAGIVLDNKENPVAYVNVGIPGKGIGGMSDKDGTFRLLIPNTLLDEQLVVSHIAYKKYSCSIRAISSSPFRVLLEDSLLALPEVSVRPLKGKWISNKGIRVPGGVMTTDKTGSLGEEIGINVKLKKDGLLEQIRLPVSECSYDSVLVRVNLYRICEGMNPELLPILPVYQTIRKVDKKENILFKFDMLPTLPAGDIRIGFEIVRVDGVGVLVFPLYSTHSFHRSVSLDDYKRSSFGIKASVYVRQ